MSEPNFAMRMLIKILPSPSTAFNWTAWLIPRSVKRKMVMVICFCQLERLRGIKKPRIEKLNRDLDLIATDSFLHYLKEFSLPLAGEILTCTDGFCDTDLTNLCKQFADSLPPAMRYGSDEEIITDIATVVAYDVG